MTQTVITESELVLVVEQETEPSIITTEVEIVVLVENTEVVLLEAVEQGPPGRDGVDGVDGSGDLSYTHTQAVVASVWTIPHNLGKRPAISILSVGGLEVWGEVLHVNTNLAIVYFDSPFAGLAECS